MGMNNEGWSFLSGFSNPDLNLKSAHDHYDVYVNGDFVGEKVLVTASDEIEHLSSYLHTCNFEDFTTELDGDHYHIRTDSDDVADAMKGQLQAYLQTR